MEVRVSYDAMMYPAMERAIEHAAGRDSDFSGMGFGMRDHGWVCKTELEARRIAQRLRALSLNPQIRN